MNVTETPYPTIGSRAADEIEPSSPLQRFIPLLLLTAGTGGFLTVQNSAEALSRYYRPYVQVELLSTQSYDNQSPAELIARIRDILSINMSDLAALMGVTRPTVYAWLEGQEPKPEALGRIRRLSHTANEVAQANIPRLDKLVRRPILEGRSLLDLLREDEDPIVAIHKLKEIADREAQTRRGQKGSGKNLRSFDEVLGESSVPIYEGS